MTKKCRIIVTGIISLISFVNLMAQQIPESIVDKVQSTTAMKNGCHPVTIEGRGYVVCIYNGSIETIQRNVIPQSIRHCDDSIYVKFLEESYASYLLDTPSPRFSDIEITTGSWSLLDKQDSDIRYDIKRDRKSFTITLFDGSLPFFSLWSPIEYQKFNAGSRTEIENRFIRGLLNYVVDTTLSTPDLSFADMRPLGDNMYLLVGEHYLNKQINSNAYVLKSSNESYSFVNTPKHPVATITNMVIHGIGCQATLDMTIKTHEYGSTAKTTVSLEQFRQYCIKSGCKLFFGVEENSCDELKGVLFCYNEREGYEHIIRLTCHPSKLGDDDFKMTAKASLFIPTTNNNFLME